MGLIFIVGWCSAENTTNSTFEWFRNIYNPYNLGNFSKMSINESCKHDLDIYLDALNREELWAAQSKLKPQVQHISGTLVYRQTVSMKTIYSPNLN